MVPVSGDVLAFWLMMAFACVAGVLIGYLLFAPRGRTDQRAESLLLEPESESVAAGLAADTDVRPEAEPFLGRRADKQRPIARQTVSGTQPETMDDATRARIRRERAKQRANQQQQRQNRTVEGKGDFGSLAARSSRVFRPDSLDSALDRPGA